MSNFHFSPRPNRAGEIAWMPWGDEAFARARTEHKPLLLSISAVWCHWCHVMDETSYSDSAVIAAINDAYVPVRVDNDERPDINARYNMGGWPTTAFLAPDGTILTGATYMPPAQMRRALEEIAQFFREKAGEIEARAEEMRNARVVFTPTPVSGLSTAMVDGVVSSIGEAYDEEFGGFGDAPKFPQPDLLEFLLAHWRSANAPRSYEMVARTMLEMSRGGMYDHVEGGFFRYSTTRDWSVPHFEKMSEDHAGLLRVLAQMQLWAPADDTRRTLRSALQYVRTVLRDPQTQLFAGSQDADESYFALPLDERHLREAPFVDRRSYTNWTAALAGTFAWASVALDDDTLAQESRATLDALHATMLRPDGLLYHVAAPGEAPRVSGLLADHAAYFRALLDAHELLGDARFRERAIAVADTTLARFEAAEGGFYDHVNGDAALGRLALADRPIVDNGLMAENLLRLGVIAGDERYRAAAERVFSLFAQTFERAGAFASSYVRALLRYLSPALSVRITGDPVATAELREAARRLPSAFTTVYSEAGEPAAYVCVGTVCAAPVSGADRLREAYDSVLVS